MKEQYITLTKSEALALFCFQEINPVSVLRDKQNILTNENHDSIIIDLRGMALIVKIFLTYKSENVRYVIQNLYARILRDVFEDENTKITFRDFRFMIPITLQFRNLTDYKSIRAITFDSVFIESVRKNLLSIGAINTYQRSIF